VTEDAEGEPAAAKKPYPGLRPFEPDESDIFFGRELITVEVIGRMGEHNLVFVHGSSGCGKSSLVRAGVLPTIQNDHELAGRPFVFRIMRPFEGPLSTLALRLADALGPPPGPDSSSEGEGSAGAAADAGTAAAPAADADAAGAWRQVLLFAPDPVEAIEAAIRRKGIDSFCLVIDQFEESFRWADERGPSEVQVMVDLMRKVAVGGSGRRFFILATMRSDYIGDCGRFPGLTSVINTCQYFLPTLSDLGLLQCIVEPARMFGGDVEPALVDRLRLAAAAEQDALPPLQHLLMRMTAVRDRSDPGWLLMRDDFDTVGGANALSQHANQLFDELVESEGRRMADESAPAGRAADDKRLQRGRAAIAEGMARLFRELIDVDAGGRGIRRPRELAKLVPVSGLERDVIVRIVDRFAAEGNNLLVRSISKTGGEPEERVDISHEALLRNWTRMIGSADHRGWLRDEVDDALIWRSLAVAARTEGAALDRVTLRDRERWYRPFEQCPERARRYLVAPEGKERIEDEPEWIAVDRLFRRSRRNRMLRRVGLGLAALLILGSFEFVAFMSFNARVQAERERAFAQQEKASAERRTQDSEIARQTRVEAAARKLLGTVEQRGSAELPALVAADLRDLSDAVGNVTDKSTGWVWIGSADRPKLLAPDRGRAVPASIRPDQIYVAETNLTLRVGPPDANNASRETVGIVTAGSRIRALGEPQRAAARNQYWLPISVLPTEQTRQVRTRIFPQFSVRTLKGDQLRRQLIADGYDVEPAEVLPQAEGLNEVRYCHAADRDRAQQFAKVVQGHLDRAIGLQQLRQCPTTAPGTLELWVAQP
jgi:hypothetical protein